MARRRGVGPGVSFFAFQDIITAVVGIFILITVILVLELAQRVEAATAGQAEDVAPIVEAIESLAAEVDRLHEEIQERSQQVRMSAELNKFQETVVHNVTGLNRSSGVNCSINCMAIGSHVVTLQRLASLNGPGSYVEVR